VGFSIRSVRGRQVFDSRGHPTVEAEVLLEGRARGWAIAPAGASRGRHEAMELRDGDAARFDGLGVSKAVANIGDVIAPAVAGFDASHQRGLDALLIELDGTPDKSRLGANAVLAVSLAVAHAAAAEAGLPLWRYLAGDRQSRLPMPMVNIISGGLHAGRNLSFQDFLIMPVGARSFAEAVEMATAVYRETRLILQDRGMSTLKADEGGFGPHLSNNEQAMEVLERAAQNAGYHVGSDVAIAVDVAASHFFDAGSGRYIISSDQSVDAAGMIDLLAQWASMHAVISIEDGLSEDDWGGWKDLTDRLGGDMQLIGDDLFTTNPERLRRGMDLGAANAILVKANQIGTLTETIDVVDMAHSAGYRVVISARSGETEDTTIADLAVATGAGQIKVGSVAQSERLAKYNRLLRIEEETDADTAFATPFRAP
jgi:enolase